jgi:uncharacterized protein DUF6843
MRVRYLLGTLFMLPLVSCGLRPGNDVSIPAGFKGWVTIRYDAAGSPPLQRNGLRPVINVPPTGEVLTSSRRSNGYGVDHFYFVASDGKRTPIKEDSHGCLESELCIQQFEYFTSPRQATVFFVGTKREMSSYKRPEVK